MKSVLLFTAFFVVMLNFSCKKEAKQVLPSPVAAIDFEKEWNATVVKVAKDVSVKLNSTAFRKMLKHEVLLRFDGDANILISSMIKRLPKYLAYEKAHISFNRTESSDPLLSSFNFDILEEAANEFPQMQIAVQTDAENWDAVSFVPKVVYLTADYNESTHSFVNGYDATQTPITVSTLEDPVDNYVVISQNERTIQRQEDVLRIRSTECPVLELMLDEPYNPELLPDPIEPCDGGGGTGGGGTGGGSSTYSQYVGVGQDGALPTLIATYASTATSNPANGSAARLNPIGSVNGVPYYRGNYKYERIRRMRCDDIGDIEGWPAGAPEIRMHTFAQNATNPYSQLQVFKTEYEPGKRSDIKDNWWDCPSVTAHLWDWTITGTKFSYGFYEYDPQVANETLVGIADALVTYLDSLNIVPGGYTAILRTVVTVGRSVAKKNNWSEYIGADDISVFNDNDEFLQNPGGFKYITQPDN